MRSEDLMMKSILISIALSGLVTAAWAAPADLVQTVTHHGETLTLRLAREDLRGAHFELWAQNTNGTYDVVTPVDERSYIGTVDEYPGAVSCGILQDDGVFRGAVHFDRGGTWFTLGGAVLYTRGMSPPSAFGHPGWTVSPGQAGTTMYGFDVGIDADYDYYSVRGGGDIARTFELIEFSVAATRALYMHDALLRPYLGRVILRTSPSQDPADGLTGGSYLDAVRTEWNTHHTDADRDVVAGVTAWDVGGGLAWVGVVGTSSAYSVNDSGDDGEFTIVWRHEMGHNWGLGHYDGGAPEGATINSGNQYARMSGPELELVLSHRDSKLGILDHLGTYGAVDIAPYAAIDSGEFVQVVDTQVTIPVMANDHDANGDALSLLSFDATSANGGTVTLQGNNLVYAIGGSFLGADSFTYTIRDSRGQTATGAAAVDVQPNDALRLYLPLDETSGTAATDQSLFANHGELSGTNFTGASVAGALGGAVVLDGTEDHLQVPGMNLSADTVTITAWIRPDAVQNDWAGIVFDRSVSASGLNLGPAGDLRYHWNDAPASYNFNSGLVPPADTWSFVALVIEPTRAVLYLDPGTGFQSAVNAVAHTPAVFGTTLVGRDPHASNRHFTGAIDDVRVYSYAVSQADLERIHLGGAAGSPLPLDGSAGVALPMLSWRGAAAATAFDVYLGTNQAAVASATATSPEFMGTTTDALYVAALADQTTYFWRVDTETASATWTGTVWSFTTDALPPPGDSILVNFEENDNQHFAGGEPIGPTAVDSANWNAVGGASGSLSQLVDNNGVPTVAGIQWASSTTWYNSDGTGDDEHRLSVGYLDDGNSGSGKGATVTIGDIPFAEYRVYGLFATDQNGSGSCGIVNMNVNGTWALGGSASTVAAAWGSINANHAANGAYWTEIVPGSVQGNYWTVETSGTTCTITGELRNGDNRGCLTAVVIEDMGGVSTTNAPTWSSSPVVEADAIAGSPYGATLADDAGDADGDTLTFSKVDGPAWLNVAANGDLGGTPSVADLGTNSWTVEVTDGITAPVQETLGITVVTAVDVANFSFELPGTVKQTHWEAVPGWSSDAVAADSGVETGQGATEGAWTGFLWVSDPSVWNLTTNVIEAGEAYTLRLDARNTGGGSALRVRLYYDHAGARATAAALNAAVSGGMQEFVLSFNSDDVPASVGKRIGIELDNVAGGWVGFDHVRLTRYRPWDTDGDGMPDAWETAHGLDRLVNDRTGNPDNDPYDNWGEYVTDTDPQDDGSYQTFFLETDPGTGDPTVCFRTSAARNYAVEYRDNLAAGGWQDFGAVFSGSGSEMAVPDPAGVPLRNYRLRVELQ